VLALLAVTAVALLVPAFAALLGVERRRHLAPAEDTSRRVRLAVAATMVALAAVGVAAVLQADPLPAVIVAVVLAGSVLVWAPLSRSWAVRGVVLWALLVTAAIAIVGWLLSQIVASSLSGPQVAVTVVVGLLLLLVLARGQRFVRDQITAQASLAGVERRPHVPVLRPVLSLAVLLAAGGAVVAVTNQETPNQGRGPQAGVSSGPGTPGGGPGTPGGGGGPVPSSAASPTLGRSPTGSPTQPGGGPATAGGLALGGEGGAASAAPALAPGTLVPGVLTRTPAAIGVAPGTAPGEVTGARVGPGKARTPVRVPTTARTTRAPAPGPGGGGTTVTPRPTPRPTPKPTPKPTPPPVPAPGTPPPPVVVTKTPGYAKPKPHRPVGVPPRRPVGVPPTHGGLGPPPLSPRPLPSVAVPTFTVPRGVAASPWVVIRTPGYGRLAVHRPPGLAHRRYWGP
jgi:hypothetical protein